MYKILAAFLIPVVEKKHGIKYMSLNTSFTTY